MKATRLATIALLTLLASPAQSADWKATEIEKHYKIDGTTPIALYKSIGEKGPVIKGNRRTIAITTWDLKWRRDYQRKGAGCTLASALPFLKITYELPQPAQKLPSPTNAAWQAFYQGIKTHEHQHGAMLRNMTQVIINQTVGLTTETDDGNCNRLREQVLAKVKQSFDAYTRQSFAFDREEMSKGGNVQKLVLGLLNPN
jgi:predicted secreted Zn-dependent protease